MSPFVRLLFSCFGPICYLEFPFDIFLIIGISDFLYAFFSLYSLSISNGCRANFEESNKKIPSTLDKKGFVILQDHKPQFSHARVSFNHRRSDQLFNYLNHCLCLIFCASGLWCVYQIPFGIMFMMNGKGNIALFLGVFRKRYLVAGAFGADFSKYFKIPCLMFAYAAGFGTGLMGNVFWEKLSTWKECWYGWSTQIHFWIDGVYEGERISDLKCFGAEGKIREGFKRPLRWWSGIHEGVYREKWKAGTQKPSIPSRAVKRVLRR